MDLIEEVEHGASICSEFRPTDNIAFELSPVLSKKEYLPRSLLRAVQVEAPPLRKSEHYCYSYTLAYIHMIAQMRGSLSSFPLMVGRKVSRLVAEVQPRQKWLTVHYLIAY